MISLTWSGLNLWHISRQQGKRASAYNFAQPLDFAVASLTVCLSTFASVRALCLA